MSLFKKRSKPKNSTLLEFINQRPIKYVTARDQDGVEIVLGKNGHIIVCKDRITITCEGKDVFSCPTIDADVGELMSHDGVRISSFDTEGKVISVVAYYVYYR